MAARQLGQQALAAAMEVLDRAPGPGPVLSVQAPEPVLDGGEGGGQVAAAVLVVQGLTPLTYLATQPAVVLIWL